MCYAKRNITQGDVDSLEADLGKAKDILIQEQQQLLRDGAQAANEKVIKEEFEKQRQNLFRVMDTVETGLHFLTKISDGTTELVRYVCPPTSAKAKQVIGVFGFGISALKQAVKYFKESLLMKIDRNEIIALDQNAKSWDHLIFTNIEEVEEELEKRRKQRASETTPNEKAAGIATGVIVSSICLTGIIFPAVGMVALGVTGGLTAIGLLGDTLWGSKKK